MTAVTVAGIDCGTNSIRLKIARVDEHGVTDVVPRMLRVVRLGQGVDETHRFSDEALERTYAAVREFKDVLDEHAVDAIRFVATSATRDADNREHGGIHSGSPPRGDLGHRGSGPEFPGSQQCHFIAA